MSDLTATTARRVLRPLVATLAVSLLLALAAAAPALAAGQRFASPTGSSSAPCTMASPCDIVTAVNGDGMMNNPSDGDEVIVEPGTYGSPTPLTTTLLPPVAETIHGVAGQPRPVIDDNGSPALLVNSASSVAYLDLETTSANAVSLFNVGATLNQLIAHSSAPNSDGCRDLGGTIMNSICWSSGAGGIGERSSCAQVGNFSAALRNVDAYATGTGGSGIYASAVNSSCSSTLSATNVIARGTGTDVAAATTTSTNTATVNLDHSDYATVKSTGPGASSVTPAGTGSNVTADPLLAGPSSGDFHEAAASPTIDEGASDPSNGSFDFEGQPRSEGGKTDIGADEYIVAPVVTASAATGIGLNGATLNGSVNPGHDTTSYFFRYGTTPAMSSATASQTLGPGRSAQPVAAQVGGLPAGTRLYWQLFASNLAGSAASAQQQFVTAATAVPLPPSITRVGESATKWREGNRLAHISRRRPPVGTTFGFTLNQAATVKLQFTQTAVGRRVGRACVAPTRRNRHKRHCARTLTRGPLSFNAHVGANKIAFQGRLSRTAKLKPGRYTVIITAIGPTGLRSTPQPLTFTIVR